VGSRKRLEAAQAQLERIRAEEARLRASSWEADKLISRAAGDTAVGPPGLAGALGFFSPGSPITTL